ncbi:MAG: ABC transporter ATP-binding protein [Candidatus Omnitrophica bacterium]|nr:ABC transporter ATP-binding protein [Candidatus Omnitrophota bacterium]MBU4478263.1 ABC transporter ATP-binding protein [Candidatus Omnitrophota bacterium]MCG2703331.1 ABC transporter ATP-binding protein [Candidatus Omnitrophota bacterium]
MILIENLTKRFGELVAVDALNLEIGTGEFFAFLGPNAAGKTTTIKTLVGLLKPTQGRAQLCGYDIQRDYLKAKTLLSYIPDAPFLYDKLTGAEFLDFVLNLYPSSNREKQMKMKDELLFQFGLDNHKYHLIENYSHGMRQKLVFAAALLHEPKVMIIDEPMVGLDPHSSRIVKDILKQKSRQGVTIFLSTHTLNVAEEIADRIGIIDKGRLIAVGTLEELKVSSGVHGKLEDVFLRLTEEES